MVCERKIRAISGQETNPKIKDMEIKPLGKNAVNTITKGKYGIVIKNEVIFIKILSIIPPNQPERTPTTIPIPAAIAADVKPTNKEYCAPYTSSLKISYPTSLVPSKNSALGFA